MLRQRHPLNQYMGPGGQGPAGPAAQQNPYGAMQRQFPRQPIRQQHPSMQGNQVGKSPLDWCKINFIT